MDFERRDDWLAKGRSICGAIEAVYADGEFIVEVHSKDNPVPFKCRLVIKRYDKAPIRNWRELQNIKNQIAGVDATAIEIYPPESEVTDTANIYHLWVLADGYAVPAILIPPDSEC